MIQLIADNNIEDMDNCLKMPTLRFRKLFAFLFVFASLCVGAQAETYWWTGGTTGNWSDPTNWSTGPDIEHLTAQAAGAPVPGSDPADIVNLISAATISVSSDVQIAQLLIPNPNLENSDFTITLTGSGSINAATKIDPVRAAGAGAGDNAKSTLVFDCDVSSAELIMHSGGDVTITEGTKATITTISNPGEASPSTMLTVNGTLISNSISLSNTTTRQMTVGPNAIVTAGTLTGSNASVTNNGLIVSNGDISSVIKEESTGSTAETGGATGFVWTGASSNVWATDSNWLNGTAPSSASDNISIPNVTTKPVITSGTVYITASKLTIVNGAYITVDGTLNITGAFSLDSKIDSTSSGTIAVNGKLTNSAAAFSATNLTLSSTTLDASKNLSCKSLNVSGESSISGTTTITSTGSGLSDGLTFGDKITQTAGSLSLISNGTVSLAGADVTTISIQAPSTISGAINTTNISIQDSATINAAINASGAFSANTNMGGKTITLAANVTAGSIALAGSSTAARLTLAGSGTLSTTNFTGSNLSIGVDIVLDDYTITTPLTGCVPSAGTSDSDYWTVLQNHWLIQDLSNYEFVWQGDDATSPNAWEVAENWNTGYVPVTDCKITIPSGNPVIPDTGTFTGGTLSIASGASVKLGTRALTLSGTENGSPATILTNIGTIIYTGNGRIRNSSGAINDITQGTIKYDGTGTGSITDFDTGTGDDYYNLVIEGYKKWSFTGSVIKIKNSISLATDEICNVSENTTLQAPVTSFDFAGSFSIADSKNITLTPYNDSDDFIIPAGMQNKFDFTGTTSGWLYLGSDSYTGTIKFNNAASGTTDGSFFPYKIRLKGATEINADIRVTNSIYAEKGIAGTNTLIFGGSGDQVFTTTGSYTYSKIQENKNGGTFKIEGTGNITDYSILKGSTATSITGACTIANLAITEATATTFSGNPTITTSFTDAPTAGNISFTNGVTINPDISLNTNGIVSFAETSQLADFTNSSASGSTSIAGSFSASDITLGTASVTGTITGTTFQSGNLTLSGVTSITTSGNQNYSGTISGTGSLTLNSTSGGTGTITFAQNISQLSTLETTGAVTLNCANITTSTSQTYNSEVTLGTTPTDTHTLTAPQITFSNKINGAAKLNLAGSTKTTLNNNIGDSSPLNLLTATGPLDIKCTSITTSGNQTYTGGAVTVSSAAASTLSSTTGTISFENSLALNQDLSLSATGTNGSISFTASSAISGASKLTVTTGNDATNSIIFAGNVGTTGSPIGELEIGNAYSTIFTNPVYIGTISDSSSSGIITFSKGGTISNAVSLATDGKVTINCQTPNPMTIGSPALANFSRTSTTGITEINGSFNAANISLDVATITGTINSSGTITMNDLIVTGNTTINSSGNQTYNGYIYGGGNLTLNSNYNSGSGNITFNKDVNGSNPNAPLTSLTTTGQLTLATNCSNITTSGNQTYNSGVTVSSTNPATITASNGTIKFNSLLSLAQNVNISSTGTNGKIDFTSSSSISGASKKLTVSTGTATTNAITFTGTVGASGSPLSELEIGNSYSTSFSNPAYIATLTDSSTGSSGDITFSNGGTISNDVDLKTTGNVSITGTPTVMTFNGSFIHLSGKTTSSGTINASSTSIGEASLKGRISTTGRQTYNGPVTLTDDLELRSTLSSGSAINFATTATITGNKKLTIDIPATTDASFNATVGNSTSKPSIDIQKANDTTFAKAVNCNAIQVIQGHNTQFTEDATISTLNVTQSNSIIFNDTVAITSLSDSPTAGEFHFNAGGSITASSGQTFNTNSKVSFGNDSSDSFVIGSISAAKTALEHTAGQTEIIGSLTAANINLDTTTLTGTVTGTDISLGTTSGGPITLIGHDITLNQNLTSESSVTITNSGLFKTMDGKDLVFADTSTANFTQNGSGNSSLGGSFSGNGNATFATDLLLYGNSAATFGTIGKNITIGGASLAKNLIISRGAACTINADTSAQNIVLYKGALNLSADLTANKDIVILGNNVTPASDLYKDASTGLTEEYIYANTSTNFRPSAWSQANYTEANLPDGTSVPTTGFTASLSVANGKTVTAAKNFYANNTSLTGTGTWNLKVPDLTNPANGFAEAYHSIVSNCNVICSDGSSNGSKARLVTNECTNGGSNTNVDFGDFEITDAYTVRDNVVYVEFNRPIRYLAAAFSTTGPLHFSAGSFTAIYSDPDCTSQITSDITAQYFYIKANGAWNTDATGKSSGATDNKSSDRSGVHHSTKPCLDFPRALSGQPFILTDIWGKRLNNYSGRPSASAAEPAYGSTSSTHNVADKTGPVLWTVRTGQELHDTYDTATGETSQHSYDSHNFLEFRYSEPVDIGSGAGTITAYSSGTTPNVVENIQVTDTLGAISENITSPATTLTFAGLAKITAATGTSLQLYTGSSGSANKYMNALYRQDPYSIRISIAGWTDGTVTDYAGNSYKKWPGYIESASQFTDATAKAVASTNTLVTDQAGNHQIEYAAGSRTEPAVLSDSSGSHTAALLPTTPADTYSPWDLSSPVFTPLRFSHETDWGNQAMSEAIGNTNGSGSTLDRIDFHFFDNTPAYDNTDPAEWFTEIGWCTPGSEASKSNLKASYSYAADIIGGARPFGSDANRTSGGIRFSTKADISPAFKYSTSANNPSPSTNFQTGIANLHTTVVSQLFTGSSAPMRPANDPDGLYLGLGLTDSSLSVETTFAFSYNDSLGYLTDLAGNRLRSKVSKTIDRTPPSFDAIISPVDTKSVYLLFVKQLVTDSSRIKFRDNSGTNVNITDSFATLMPKCFRIISIDASGTAVVSTENQIDTSIPAEVVESFSNDSFTCIKLTTTKEINIENLKNLYIQLITPAEYPQTASDPLTNNTGSRVTLIQDLLGNYMSMYSAHALSDFAVNYVNPLYAYSTDMLYEDQSIMNGLYEAGSWAVHDWNADQQNYGTLPAGYPISIVADTKGDEKIRVYLSPSPDADSVSKQFNSDFDAKFRIWLPALQDSLFRALSAANNTNFVYSDGQLLDASSVNSLFNITKETVSSWQSGSQISFMFGLMQNSNSPVRIYNNPYYDVSTDKFNLSLSIPVPLYCLRMPDTADLNTLDLWSFKIKGITAQRGGVTILNNVINASNDEKAVVIVDMPEDGNLTVCVMTLDGNIITYLNRGNTKAGEYYYTWNGKNKNGKSVARGMYFVRVLGGGIDETRKVMVVKD